MLNNPAINQQETLDPDKYFDYLKNKKVKMTDEFLNMFSQIIQKEASKALAIGQDHMLKRLAFVYSSVEKEYQLLQEGIDTYVLKDDIEEYIKEVKNRVVKIIELEYYPRTIPDEIAERVMRLKQCNLFDAFYVVFTDYTGEVEKKVKQEERRKDPILFGTFKEKIDGMWDLHDRFYYIGDWEDDYCDLTLTKMVEAMSKKGKDIAHSTDIPDATQEEINAYLGILEAKRVEKVYSHHKKKTLSERIKLAVDIMKGN
jgi:hypothetical protein